MTPEDAAPREQLAAALEDTPDAPEQSGPEGTPAESEDSTPQDNYEQRYNDLRSEFDRRNQRFAQYEQFIQNLSDPDTQAAALASLGLEVDSEDDDADEYEDPQDRLNERLEQMESYLQEQAETQRQAELAELEEQYISQELSELDTDLTDAEKDAVVRLSRTMTDDENIPDVKGAFEALKAAAEAQSKRYVESKKAPKVEVGQAGSEKIDLADDDARVKLMADMLEAGQVE